MNWRQLIKWAAISGYTHKRLPFAVTTRLFALIDMREA